MTENHEEIFTKTSQVDSKTGAPLAQQSSGRAAHVLGFDFPPGNLHICEALALDGTPVTLDWSALPYGVKAAAIYAYREDATLDGTGAAAELPEVAACCIDPPNSVVRDTWLTAGSALAGGAERLPVFANGEPLVLFFRDNDGNFVGIDNIGIKRDIGSNPLRIIAVGVEADA